MYANSDATVLTGQTHLHISQHPSNRTALVGAYFPEKYEQSELGDHKRSPWMQRESQPIEMFLLAMHQMV